MSDSQTSDLPSLGIGQSEICLPKTKDLILLLRAVPARLARTKHYNPNAATLSEPQNAT